MENKENNQRNPLGTTGFIIAVVLAALSPILIFILSDLSRRGPGVFSHLGLDIMMLLFFIPFAMCFIASKRKPKTLAVVGAIISLVFIVVALILRMV
ncbi:MAG: hypothetical protein J6X59_08150 [Bacteroidales bacterium]|nr:hypothetical protein [Bacteroidales bacterium]